MSATAVTIPDVEALEFEVIPWPERARALTIDTSEQYQIAGDWLRDIKTLRAKIDAAFDPVIAAAHMAHRAACDAKKAQEAPLCEAEAVLKTGLARFVELEERRRREEEQRLREAALRAEEEDRLAEATALEAHGEHELAQQVLAMPSVTPVPAPPPATKAEGVSTSTRWRGEVTDLKALCAAIAAGTVPVTAVTPSASTINAAARAMREQFNWPGCRAIRETAVAAKARAC